MGFFSLDSWGILNYKSTYHKPGIDTYSVVVSWLIVFSCGKSCKSVLEDEYPERVTGCDQYIYPQVKLKAIN